MNEVDAAAQLKALLGIRRSTEESRMPPGELRFVLEYPDVPDVGTEIEALETILGETKDFVLRPLFRSQDGALGRFLVLRFPGIGRVFGRDAMFDFAHQLRRERNLVSAEPDLDADLYVDPEPPGLGHVESADFPGSFCWVNKAPPPDHRWALTSTRILDAWASSNKGAGIVLGQPDTGVATHAELELGSLLLDRAWDVLDNDADPTDPLDPDTANPGHGTATASVAVSRENGAIAGAAPAAQLVPIRCIQDVKVWNAAPVAAAVDHAVRVGCHVVTMSLGGLPSRALEAAIERAIAQDVIVMAAAGNCVRLVVYPARYPAVVAVAGTNMDDEPWRGSSRGSAVDISAPAELVWRAERTSPTSPVDGVGGGQGTSYAVALVAGAAALWLSRHGREAVIAEARSRGVKVQTLFRSALQASARVPANWDSDEMGPGILDAAALNDLALTAIPNTRIEAAAVDSDGLDDLVSDVSGQTRPLGAIDRRAYGLEIAALAFDQSRRSRLHVGPGQERSTVPAPASAALYEAIRVSQDERLIMLAERIPPVSVLRPTPPVQGGPPLRTTVAIVGVAQAPGLESKSRLTAGETRRALTKKGIAARMRELEEQFRAIEGRERPPTPEVRKLQKQTIDQAPALLERFKRKGKAAEFDLPERVALEALVRLTDRPAVRVKEDGIDPDDPLLKTWRGTIAALRRGFPPILKAIGRIDAFGQHVGTGFVVAPGIVMTNRHVIEAFADPAPSRRNPSRWILPADVATVNFSDAADDASALFKVKGIFFAGPDPIGGKVTNSNLDMALLEVEKNNGKNDLPVPLPIIKDAGDLKSGGALFVAGFPAVPEDLPLDAAGKVRQDIEKLLWEMFGSSYGVKYFSPGEAITGTGSLADDPLRWIFTHDAATLPGNSGSCVVRLGDPIAVLGLHFAGDWLRANFAHSLAAVSDAGRIPMTYTAEMTWTGRSR